MEGHANTSPAFTLMPINSTDVPTLINIDWEAFRSDMFDSLMCINRPEGIRRAMIEKTIIFRDDYDLAEWAPGRKYGSRGWGFHTFRHMMRPAIKIEKLDDDLIVARWQDGIL